MVNETVIPAAAVEAAEYVFDIDAINESVMRLFEKLSEPESLAADRAEGLPNGDD